MGGLGLLRSSNAGLIGTVSTTAPLDVYEKMVLMGASSNYPVWCCPCNESARGRLPTSCGSLSWCQSPLEFHFSPKSDRFVDQAPVASRSNYSATVSLSGELFNSTEDVNDKLPLHQHSDYADGTHALRIADIAQVPFSSLVQDKPASCNAITSQVSLFESIKTTPVESSTASGSPHKLCLLDFVEGKMAGSSTAKLEKQLEKGREYPGRWMRGRRGGARQWVEQAKQQEREMHGMRSHRGGM